MQKVPKTVWLTRQFGPFWAILGPCVFRCVFNFVSVCILGSARAVVGSMLKIGQFYDHLNFGKYEPGHLQVGPIPKGVDRSRGWALGALEPSFLLAPLRGR